MTSRCSSLVDDAERARHLVVTDPIKAEHEAQAVLHSPNLTTEAKVVALRALALALSRQNDAPAAHSTLRRAIRVAESYGLSYRAGEARLSLIVILADLGRLQDAMREARAAARILKGWDLGQLRAQTGLVHTRAGQYTEALHEFERALGPVEDAGDIHWTCLILNNRATAFAYLGRFQEARQDLRRCIDFADAQGFAVMSAKARQNLGFVSLREGDIPQALRLLNDVASRLHPGTHALPALLLDHADAFMSGRLLRESLDTLARAADALREGGFAVDVAEAQVLLARAQLLDSDANAAAKTATEAAAEFRRQRRPGWTALADHLALQARVEAGERSRSLLTQLKRSATQLTRRGWANAAVHSHLLAGQVAHDLQDDRTARREFETAATARHKGPIEVRAAAWYATALRRLIDGDQRGTLTAAGAGLRAVDEFAASLGATDLRVHASGWGKELATLGATITHDAGDAWRYLTWVERWRANALRTRPVRPPTDKKLADDLAQLRRVTSDLAATAARGEDTRGLAAEQTALERGIRDRSRIVTGPAYANAYQTLDRDQLAAALRDRALVELTNHDGSLVAVTLAGGRCTMHELGPVDAVTAEMDSLRFSLHRLARRHGSAASLAAAEAGVAHSGNRLDALIFAPLRDMIGDRDLVITPTDTAHALPWSALPSLLGRTVTVAPSVTMWLRSVRALRSRARTTGPVAIAGPDLEHAQAEVRAVARHHPAMRQMTGRRATVDAAMRALDGAAIAHIAAHGTFRSDNPQFSALDLHDGPLTVYDLERMRWAPRQLVLSACDTALSAVHAGDELQGVAAAFFTLGTATLIASVTPVADDQTRTLMNGFHRRLAAGMPPGRALAETEASTGTLGFVCFGAGD